MRKIASKVSKRLSKLKTGNVIDLSDYRQQKKAAEELFDQIATAEQNIRAGRDPLYAVYIHAQNLLSVLAECLQDVPEPSLNRFFSTIEAADNTYVPQGPPMSPLTVSYFNCWLLFDLSVGIDKETLATIIIDLADQFGLDKQMIAVMNALQRSRMGIYEFMGQENDKVLLRELTGNDIITCLCPAGYQGSHPGELWFARILPPALGLFDYSLVFTTSYVLLDPDKKSWIAYLNRTIGGKKTRTTASSLENLMKYGLSENYWHEYIFESYVNHRPEAVFLKGLPDIRSSRPHHTDNPEFASILPDCHLP
ncbi:hypothetical protein [Methylobacter luteus]|uniref:hypothetical protein n=1 Tax=Methylobacter luteus TaxID=415 RepID=UPI000427C116|nr:hypothetical protein [Methylobacter luteus]